VARPAGPPPRRPANRRLVGVIGLVAGLVAVLALGGLVAVLGVQQRHADAVAARNQRFVDTAAQTLVNMYSFTQDNLEESVKRFVDGTSGPLHDQLSQDDNVANLAAVLRATGGASEAVVNGAALEGVDDVNDNASVLVAVRVTPSDVDGNNQPSTPYRFRVIVHEDGNDHMTVYDLKYPNGGN
jgi:Mce-associated membrane protein